MDQRTRTIVVLCTAALYAGFAVWLGVRPDALLQGFGVTAPTAAMLTEIRAFYGGLELGIAVVMVVLWRQGHVGPALLIGGVPLAGSASGRLIGLVADGYSSLHLGFALFEFIGFAVCLAGYRAIARTERPRVD